MKKNEKMKVLAVNIVPKSAVILDKSWTTLALLMRQKIE